MKTMPRPKRGPDARKIKRAIRRVYIRGLWEFPGRRAWRRLALYLCMVNKRAARERHEG